MKNTLLFSFLLFLIACNKDDEKQTLDLVYFTIDVPASWEYVEKQGFDSFVGSLEIGKDEIIDFDYGWYSNNLGVVADLHDISYATIDGKTAKIVRPVDYGHGTTGVYFDSLETTKNWKFQMSAFNLKEKNQKLLLTAIETLNFD